MSKTILFGGLTPLHELLIKGAVESQNYHAEFLPTPDNISLSVGREFCNRGMCNPAYYTIGNLIKFLQQKSKEGVNVENKYIFTTIGACGPCRFGMYEAEYRHALKEAGFPNLQLSILNQSEFSSEGEVKLTPGLIWQLVKAVWLADIIREIGYRLRPYEETEGSVDEIVEKHSKRIYQTLKSGGKLKDLLKELLKFKESLKKLSFNYLQPKPIVSVIGEFWVHTTEGDGNYRIHRWLEEEGAEVKPEPIAGWIDYQLFIEREKTILDMKVKGITYQRFKKLAATSSMAFVFRQLYNLFRSALNFRVSGLPDQKKLAKLAAPYFDHFVVGGEGHLEVAKHIYSIKYRKAHMVLSVKPFGCMPSTQSDGVQSKVQSDFPSSIFISVETSGDAEINVKSRIQMKLFEAKRLAEEEFETVLRKLDLSINQLKNSLTSELKEPFVKLSKKYISTAAKFIDANHNKFTAERNPSWTTSL